VKVDQPLRVLHLEDNARDAELVRDLLEAGGVVCDITRVQTREEFVASLQNGFDVILADYSLPSFDGVSALKIAALRSPDVPFIFVSGALGEELAIEALKTGATDYVLKERPSSLVPSVQRALRESRERLERKRAEEALRASEERFRALVQFSFDVYWESDAEHRFTHQEFSEGLTGAPARGAEIGKTRWEVPYVEPDEEAWRKHRATLDAHLPFRDFELARPTADGGTRYVSVSGIPAFDEIGRFVGYRGVGRDITERKRAEAEHRAHLWFLESMDRVNRAMQGTDDLQQMLSDVFLATLDIFACDRAWLIYPCDPDAPSWHAVMEHTRPQFPGAFALQGELPVDREVAAVFAAARAAPGAVLFGPDYDLKIPALAADRFAVRSQIAIAIDVKANKPYLFGLHQCSRARVWTAEEQRLFQEIGRRLSDTISALSIFRSLRESERNLDAAQRIAHVGWWERDYVNGHVSLSDEACRIFGVQPLELPQWQERWVSLIHPEDRERTAAASEVALRGGARYDVEYRVVRPDGIVRVVHSQGDVTRDESGRPVRQFGVMQDITELRHAEEELRASEARFRTFVDRATDAFFLLDEQLDVVDVNRQACETLGWSREELIGMHPREFDVALDEPSIQRLAQRARAGEVVTFETRHRPKDRTIFPVEVRSGTFEQGGKLFYLALARDISERKLAEESLRQSEAYLTEAQRLSHTGSWAFDVASNRYVYTSEESDRIYGFDPQGEPPSREAVFERIHPDDRSRCQRNIEKSIRDKVDTVDEYRIVLPDGSLRHIHAIRHPLLNDAGEVVRLVGTSIDITERKLAEEALREKDDALRMARTELERMSRLTTLGELTTSIAHEVSQPLGAMVASAGACVRWLGAEPPAMMEARSALDNIVADGKRAREVIARIRALTKRQAPRMELLDLNRKIREVLALTEQELRSHDIVLETRLDSTVPQVTGDRVQLQQVFLNLIVNAIEAMSAVNDRPRELTIVSAQGKDGVVVEVRDSGIGLDPHRADQVFDSFYTTKAEGLGIGLSISRSIVEAHGGRLWAAANEPHGAVFRFSLPVAEDGQS
jgi:PAS domain S-box-containing protein